MTATCKITISWIYFLTSVTRPMIRPVNLTNYSQVMDFFLSRITTQCGAWPSLTLILSLKLMTYNFILYNSIHVQYTCISMRNKFELHESTKFILIWLVYLLFNVTFNDISVTHVTAYRCVGGLKKLELRSGSHTIHISYGSLTRPSELRHVTLFTVIPRNCPISVAFYDAHGDTEDLFSS